MLAFKLHIPSPKSRVRMLLCAVCEFWTYLNSAPDHELIVNVYLQRSQRFMPWRRCASGMKVSFWEKEPFSQFL